MRIVLTIFYLTVVMASFGVRAGTKGKDLSSRVLAPMLPVEVTPDAIPNWLPSYLVERKHQVRFENGWTGSEDFSAKLSFGWTAKHLVFIFDVTDDIAITSESVEPKAMTGDHILIKVVSGTAMPNLTKESFDVLLIPDVEKGTCRPRLLNSSGAAKLIGTPSCEMKVKDGKKGYVVVMRIPLRLWATKPSENKDLTFQVLFGDSDTSGAVDHSLMLFERWPGATTAEAAKGTMQFVGNAWARVRPTNAKQDGGSLKLFVDWTNRTAAPIGLSIMLKDRLGTVVKTYSNVVDMTAAKGAVGKVVEVKLPELGAGKEFDVIPKIGSTESLVAFSFLADPDKKDSIFCQRWVDRQSRLRRRKLAVIQRPDLIEETFRTLAGGGTVLWHAGVYDNSSREFEEMMHPNGAFVIKVAPGRSPAANQVPWALFGGGDALDGMNEPLVLDLSTVAAGDAFEREIPNGFVYLHQNKSYRRHVTAVRKLLLVGLTCLKSDGDHHPEIRITNQKGEVLLTESLRPGRSQFPQQPHAFILRVWLRAGDTRVQISNVTKVGSKVEIDFMALLGGGEPVKIEEGQPRIEFSGTPDADYLTKMLAVNMFLCRNYMVSQNGTTFASPPGGSQFLFSLMDHCVLLEELSAWGLLDITRDSISSLGSASSLQHKSFIQNDTSTDLIQVMAAWNLWRKSGLDDRVISALWIPVVEMALNKVVDASMTNKMGLMSGSGEFGIPDDKRGVTVPLQDLAVAALTCGIDMANASNNENKVAEWTEVRKKIIVNMHLHLVAAPGGEKLNFPEIFPATYGMPEQKGITATIPPGAYVYARDANREIVPYNGNVRVYDTPYLFSGLPYLVSNNGMILDPAKAVTVRKTIAYARSGAALNGKTFTERHVTTFKSSSTQMWTAMALLLTDNVNFGGKVVEGLVRYTFDGFASIPDGADMELSPYAIEEGLSVGKDYDNLGGVHDECRATSVASFLKLARIMAGVDDHDVKVLHLTPRLPYGWKSVTTSDWLIAHDFDPNNKSATVNVTYRRKGKGYVLDLHSDRELRKVKIRLGPFRSTDRAVQVWSGGDRSERMKTKSYGGSRWVEVTLEHVRNVVVEAKPSNF